jgi:hypothetical protein
VLLTYRYSSEKEMAMSVTTVIRIAGTAGILVALPLVAAMAQTQSPPSSSPTPPAATTPQTNPPPAAPQATPSTPNDKKASAAGAIDNLLGLTAKSSDGTNLGTVQSVITGPGGKTTIGLKVGGFLGFGGHTVAIPDDKFNHMGDTVQVNMTADEVNKLPKVGQE